MAKIKIKPLRTMQLDKRRVEQGKVEEVSEAEGKLAIRHGWAVLATADDSKGSNEPTVDELKQKLTELKVEIPAKANKAKLLELLADAEKAAEEADANENADAEAKAAWEASDELQAEFPEVEDYIASLKQE